MSNIVINPYQFFTNNRSLDMDGSNDYSNLADLSSGSGVNTGIISFWFKRDTDSIFRFLSIQESTHDAGDQAYINIRSTSNSPPNCMEIRISTGGVNQVWRRYTGATISNNIWYHCAFRQSADGSTGMQCYIDGTEVTTYTTGATENDIDAFIGDLDAVNASRWILGSNQISQFNFDGKMDEITVWSSAKASLITELYNSGSPPDPTYFSEFNADCLLYLKCGDHENDDDTTMYDTTTNAHNFTHVNHSPGYSTDTP